MMGSGTQTPYFPVTETLRFFVRLASEIFLAYKQCIFSDLLLQRFRQKSSRGLLTVSGSVNALKGTVQAGRRSETQKLHHGRGNVH